MEFPYAFRNRQKEMLDALIDSSHGGHIVLEAGTGIGKTVCALFAAGSEALEEDKRVLYLVRTNSQQRQVLLEARKLQLPTVALQGRHNMCPLLRYDSDFQAASADDLSRACNDKKNRTLKGEEGCVYYRLLLSQHQETLRRWILRRLPTAEELSAHCTAIGVCPYELTKSILPDARVVTAPYAYFFHPSLRRGLLRWMETTLEKLVLVVDEAHNLPEYAREVGSARLSLASLRLARAETEQYGDPEVLDGVSMLDVCDLVRTALVELVCDCVDDEDGILPPSAFEECLMGTLATTSTRIKQLSQNVMMHGEVVREQKRLEGRIPRSHIASLGAFLLFWFVEQGWEFARLAVGGGNPALECYCLDPSEVTSVVTSCCSSIHMSGTLSPLEEYRDSIGLPPETILRRFPSPFPPENRRVFVAKTLTTRHEVLSTDPTTITRLKDELLRILLSVRKNTAVFFPSHDLLRQFLDLRDSLQRPLFVEEQNMEQSELMSLVERFRSSNAILFAVFGGRVSEGMDFPAKDLELVVLVGVPYPKPTAKMRSLINFYDAKFQRGWEYCMEASARRKLMQAIGRLIRSETDRGAAIILDNRAKRFRDVMPEMKVQDQYLEDVDAFYRLEEHVPTCSGQLSVRPPSTSISRS